MEIVIQDLENVFISTNFINPDNPEEIMEIVTPNIDEWEEKEEESPEGSVKTDSKPGSKKSKRPKSKKKPRAKGKK